MIYRINLQNFLTHAIDHFTRDELSNMYYSIISAKVRHTGTSDHVGKINELYPTPEIVSTYAECKDKKILEKMYIAYLDESISGKERSSDESGWLDNKIYTNFINPLLKHQDNVIICDKDEDEYVDIICKYFKKRFHIEVIDLNELFTTGRVGPIYIDRKDIWDKAVDIRRAAGREQIRSLESSKDGRFSLLKKMTKKEKIKKLKELGILINKSDLNDLDKLLIEEWVESED